MSYTISQTRERYCRSRHTIVYVTARVWCMKSNADFFRSVADHVIYKQQKAPKKPHVSYNFIPELENNTAFITP